jgi:CRISPR system Cascade subunit CasB
MTDAATARLPRQRSRRSLGTFVANRVTAWQRDYVARRPAALAALAQLRRGVGEEVGAIPELWQYTLEGLPEPEGPAGPGPGREPLGPTVLERAAYTALTLFAVHQQSRRKEMHLPGQSLGTAVRQLAARAASAEAVQRRFVALGTAQTFTEVVHHARGLITQLRAEDISLDYGMFAEDLVRLQTGAADQVRLRWGRDFYRTRRDDADSTEPDTASTDDATIDSPAAGAAPSDEEE